MITNNKIILYICFVKFNSMKTLTKNLFIVALLFSIVNVAIADRGIGRKNKNKTILNISTTSNSIRNSIPFNLKSGLTYSGSLLSNNTTGNNLLIQSVITYQKGNITYIIPYKQKVIIPEINQGYTGMKIIIRPR